MSDVTPPPKNSSNPSDSNFLKSIGFILSKSVELVRQSYHRLFIIAFVQALLIRLAMVLFPLPQGAMMGDMADINAGTVMGLLGLAVIVLLVGAIGNALMQACFVSKIRDQSARMGEVFNFVFHKAGRLFSACVIYYSLMTLGMMLYVLPAVLLGAVFFLYLPSLLFEEEVTALGALKRSWQLTRTKFGIMLVLYIFTSLLYLLPQLLIQDLNFLNISGAILNVLMIFAASLTLPLCNAICVTTYSYRRLEIAAKTKPVKTAS